MGRELTDDPEATVHYLCWRLADFCHWHVYVDMGRISDATSNAEAALESPELSMGGDYALNALNNER